jgi:hypothetical protein
MARGLILGLGGVILLGALGTGGWFWRARQERREVLAALGRYERALKRQDLEALRGSLASARAKDLADPGAAAGLAMAAALRPASYGIAKVEVGWRAATLELHGNDMKGTVDLVKEGGAWRIAKESWKADLGGPTLPPAKIPRRVQTLLDRMAGPDPVEGAKAWAALGGAYTNPDYFFEDVRGAFDDPRPIAFKVEWISNVYGGQRYSGWTGKQEPIGPDPGEVRTVGDALRRDMWRMEGAGLGENPKPFGPWWAAYRKARGLGPEPGGAGLAGAAPDSAPAGEPQVTMTLTMGGETPAAAPTAPETPLTGDLSADYKDPKIPAKGEAWGTLDDRPVRFLLATGFWSDTRFDDPRRGTLDFRAPGATKGSNSRRVQLTFDATRTGDHDLGNGEATLKLIEDGGQVFPPRAGGVLRVNTAYGDGKLDGEVPEILLHSAGIQKRLVLRFTVDGSLRKAR